jgi:hypothetical protein
MYGLIRENRIFDKILYEVDSSDNIGVATTFYPVLVISIE